MLQTFKNGQGSIVLRVKLLDSTATTGAGKTGLSSSSSGLIIATIADNEATATTYTQAGSTIETITTLGTFAAPTATKCRFKEVDATNHKGIYEIQLADARFAVASAKSLLVSLSGVTGMAEADFVIQLQSIDPYVAPGSSGGLLISGSNSGTTTLGALTVTGTMTVSDGIAVSRSSSNTSAITATGNGTGSGIVATSGSGATGDGIQATSAATNGNGFALLANGTGNALKASSISGDAILTSVSTSGHGATFAGTGTTKHGVNATGGATTSHGINATGGGVGHGILATSGGGATGDGIKAVAASTAGNGLNLAGTTSGAGLLATGGSSGDGFKGAGGSGSGHGMQLTGTTDGAGLRASATGTGQAGIYCSGGSGPGMRMVGAGANNDGLLISANSGHGINTGGTGTTKHGINATGGATTSHGINAVGGGVGHGILATSGGGATGDGIRAVAASTNGNGLNLAGVGTGAGALTTGGATGIGLSVVGGATSGDAIKAVTTSGHGINLAPVGTSKHGLFATGGNGGTSDGISAVAGTGGVPIRGDITGNITGAVSGAVGSVTGAVGSVTGNVGGNVVGSVASVTAAVSITGDLSATMKASVNTEVDTAISDAALATAANLATVAGYLDTEIASILADTNELQTDWADGGRLDLILDARASQTSVDTVDDFLDTEVAAIKAKTDQLVFTVANQLDVNVLDWKSATAPAMTGDAFARLGAPAGASVSADVAAIKAVDDAVKAKTDNLPSDPADASDITAAFSTVNSTLATIAAYVDTEVGAIKAVTDKLDDTLEDDAGTYRFTANALEEAPTGGTAPTASAIADEVQTRTIAAVTLVNGLAANTVTAAALATDAVTEIQAGLATAAALATVATYVDTEVAAIKAKTDNLPSDPADQSLIIDATNAIMSRIGAPVGADISADLAAVKAQAVAIEADTNELQTDWVNGGRLDNILDARASQSSVDTVDGIVDSILIDTAEIGTAGAGLTALATQVSVNDLPTNAELATALSTADDATLSALSTVAGDVAAIKASTDNLPSDPADQSLVIAATNAIMARLGVPSVSLAADMAALLTTALTEAYRADGSAGSVAQMLYELVGHMGESSISGTTKTVKKIDGSTPAMTFTLNSSSAPTAVTRSS